MADEKEVQPPADNPLQATVDQLQQKNNEYENLLLDPTYLDFLANGNNRQAVQRVAQQQAPSPGQVDWDSMTNKDLAEYMVATMRGMLNSAVVPMQQTQQVRDAMQQVQAAQQKYPDFVEYKDSMLRIAQRNPNITAEEAYHIAKGQNPRRPTAPKKSAGSPPAGGGSTASAADKGFNSAFLKAWEAAGLGANRGDS